jgi:hypothetical protein
MPDQQEFLFAPGDAPQLGYNSADDPLICEIARVWNLPIGRRVRLRLRADESLPNVDGCLEIVAAPATPFNPKEPLTLRVRGYKFSSRAIIGWSLE